MKEMPRKEVLQSVLDYHNHSWFEDIYQRNCDNKEKTALFFRGTKITYGEFFDMVIDYAKSLKEYGVKKGDEFVACLRQSPDYPVIVAAASLIGAKVNLISSEFNIDYIGQIIERANSNVVLVSDWDLKPLAPALKKSASDKVIVSLPVSKWDKYNNPYKEITDKFYKFDEEEYKECLKSFNNVIETDEFLKHGENYKGEVCGHGKLDDEIAITYTSGSTSKGVHKGVVQRNKTYIIMGRYHDPEVAGIPKMDNTVTLTPIGAHADTTLLTGVSDTLLQGGTVALDPIIDEYYFPYSLKINNAGLVIATRTYWIRAMKETYENSDFKNVKLPYLYVPSEGGEPLAAGEEKALNKWLKDVKAGTKITHTPVSVVKMTVGGGDSEHGSLFISLYRDYRNGLQKLRGINEPIGLEYYGFADVEVLRENGTYCKPLEMGRLVANSPISMEKYHNNKEATEKYFIKDYIDKKWGDLGCYGYKDKYNNVYIKGRIGENDPKIKTFQLADEILRDTKNIMSCEVIDLYLGEDGPTYVAHIEMQYNKKVNIEKTLLAAEQRCKNAFGNKLDGKLYFRVRNHEEGFPTLFTAKRNVLKLREEGLSNLCIIPSEEYLKKQPKNKVLQLTKSK